MKLLLDNALSPVVAHLLGAAGHDAVHVRDLGLAKAEDTEVFAQATEDERTVISADTDFGTILALRALHKPSVVLWRRATPRRPEDQAPIIAAVLEDAAGPLEAGAIVVIEAERVRIRKLPIGGDGGPGPTSGA